MAFSKAFLVDQGASPVFYRVLDAAVMTGDELREMATRALERKGKSEEQIRRGTESIKDVKVAITNRQDFDNTFESEYIRLMSELLGDNSPLEKDQRGRLKALKDALDYHIFSSLCFFDHTLPEDHPKNWYMEREWRKHGNLHFKLADVRRVILPEAYAQRFRTDLPEYCGQLTFAD